MTRRRTNRGNPFKGQEARRWVVVEGSREGAGGKLGEA